MKKVAEIWLDDEGKYTLKRGENTTYLDSLIGVIEFFKQAFREYGPPKESR